MRTDPRRGVILLAVLWTVALLSALAMATSVTFREFAGIVTIDRDRLRAEALLTAGLETAAGVMARWPEARPLHESEMAFGLSTGQVRVRVTDEAGRIDIGKAPVEVLASLLGRIGAGNPDGLARAIVDWRTTTGGAQPPAPDAASPARRNLGTTAATGTQNEQATGASPAKPQDNNAASGAMPFTDIRQLLNVPGVTPELVAAATPFITVFGGEKVNALTASPQVLAMLPGMSADRVAALVEARGNLVKDDTRITTMLGDAQNYAMAGGRKIASVVVQARVTDGYSAAAQAIVIPSPQDPQPYHMLAWNPWPAALSNWSSVR